MDIQDSSTSAVKQVDAVAAERVKCLSALVQ
jgi:hypothetical protein